MKKIVIGISGASGVIYGIRLLEQIYNRAETHLIITEKAREIIEMETDFNVSDVEKKADYVYRNDNMNASVASGSFLTDGMVILPCSIKSLSAIAMSYNETLLIRAADVMVKEKRKLILGVREMPFHEGHLQLMLTMANRGAIICPPVPAFYNHPDSVMDICDYVAGKIMDLLGIENEVYTRWDGNKRL